MKHFAKKVKYDGYTFDSRQEMIFYRDYIKPSGQQCEVHPRFTVWDGGPSMGHTVGKKYYTPDFVTYKDGERTHVYDIKPSIKPKWTTGDAKDRISMFEVKENQAVEIVELCSNGFKVTVFGYTTKTMLDKHAKRDRHGEVKLTALGNPRFDRYNFYKNIDYDIRDFMGS